MPITLSRPPPQASFSHWLSVSAVCPSHPRPSWNSCSEMGFHCIFQAGPLVQPLSFLKIFIYILVWICHTCRPKEDMDLLELEFRGGCGRPAADSGDQATAIAKTVWPDTFLLSLPYSLSTLICYLPHMCGEGLLWDAPRPVQPVCPLSQYTYSW